LQHTNKGQEQIMQKCTAVNSSTGETLECFLNMHSTALEDVNGDPLPTEWNLQPSESELKAANRAAMFLIAVFVLAVIVMIFK